MKTHRLINLKTLALLGAMALGAASSAHATFTSIAAGGTVSPVPQDALFPAGGTVVQSLTSPWSDGVNSGSLFTQVYETPTFTDFYYFLNLDAAPGGPENFVAGVDLFGFTGKTTSVAIGLDTPGFSDPDSAQRFLNGSAISFTFLGVPGIDQGQYGGNPFSNILAIRVSGSFGELATVTSDVQGGNGIASVQTLALAVPDSGATVALLGLGLAAVALFQPALRRALHA